MRVGEIDADQSRHETRKIGLGNAPGEGLRIGLQPELCR